MMRACWRGRGARMQTQVSPLARAVEDARTSPVAVGNGAGRAHGRLRLPVPNPVGEGSGEGRTWPDSGMCPAGTGRARRRRGGARSRSRSRSPARPVGSCRPPDADRFRARRSTVRSTILFSFLRVVCRTQQKIYQTTPQVTMQLNCRAYM